jgi:hypothetical protein
MKFDSNGVPVMKVPDLQAFTKRESLVCSEDTQSEVPTKLQEEIGQAYDQIKSIHQQD